MTCRGKGQDQSSREKTETGTFVEDGENELFFELVWMTECDHISALFFYLDWFQKLPPPVYGGHDVDLVNGYSMGSL